MGMWGALMENLFQSLRPSGDHCTPFSIEPFSPVFSIKNLDRQPRVNGIEILAKRFPGAIFGLWTSAILSRE
jgi:hypothetical protein